MRQARRLRIFQIIAIVYVLFLFLLVRILPATSGASAITPVKLIIVFLALYCAFGGFTLQRRLHRVPARPKAVVKSTPVRRWMVGHVIRLAFAIAVSLYGFLLHVLGGPEWLATLLIALGLILLLIWRPGDEPVEQNQQTNPIGNREAAGEQPKV
jgi:hypothetical protein